MRIEIGKLINSEGDVQLANVKQFEVIIENSWFFPIKIFKILIKGFYSPTIETCTTI